MLYQPLELEGFSQSKLISYVSEACKGMLPEEARLPGKGLCAGLCKVLRDEYERRVGSSGDPECVHILATIGGNRDDGVRRALLEKMHEEYENYKKWCEKNGLMAETILMEHGGDGGDVTYTKINSESWQKYYSSITHNEEIEAINLVTRVLVTHELENDPRMFSERRIKSSICGAFTGREFMKILQEVSKDKPIGWCVMVNSGRHKIMLKKTSGSPEQFNVFDPITGETRLSESGAELSKAVTSGDEEGHRATSSGYLSMGESHKGEEVEASRYAGVVTHYMTLQVECQTPEEAGAFLGQYKTEVASRKLPDGLDQWHVEQAKKYMGFDATGQKNITPLLLAVMNNETEYAAWLIAQGADINHQGELHSGRISPLECAIMKGCYSTTTMLDIIIQNWREKGGARTKGELTALNKGLLLAILEKKYDYARKLLELGANPAEVCTLSVAMGRYSGSGTPIVALLDPKGHGDKDTIMVCLRYMNRPLSDEVAKMLFNKYLKTGDGDYFKMLVFMVGDKNIDKLVAVGITDVINRATFHDDESFKLQIRVIGELLAKVPKEYLGENTQAVMKEFAKTVAGRCGYLKVQELGLDRYYDTASYERELLPSASPQLKEQYGLMTRQRGAATQVDLAYQALTGLEVPEDLAEDVRGMLMVMCQKIGVRKMNEVKDKLKELVGRCLGNAIDMGHMWTDLYSHLSKISPENRYSAESLDKALGAVEKKLAEVGLLRTGHVYK